MIWIDPALKFTKNEIPTIFSKINIHIGAQWKWYHLLRNGEGSERERGRETGRQDRERDREIKDQISLKQGMNVLIVKNKHNDVF